ncbi:hypothetical protein Mgra_00000105 [Meloidogyne graminicola]|uniref:Uncharacterized protein n=1 Tax=Meloidogyne graminicola TaxID=189291 RepID=A0A8T0A359_9BILA|nr:hypothetical protein Mgra_00000105 [Meloidogyne graminicola]
MRKTTKYLVHKNFLLFTYFIRLIFQTQFQFYLLCYNFIFTLFL